MKRVIALLFLALIVVGVFPVAAADSADLPAPMTPAVERVPGVDLAQGISQLTGVAISPLLGVSSVGVWYYFHAPAERRERLPWFCHPFAWGFGFALLGICFLKDLFGAAAPPLLKKPLDVLELFENKLSALLACSTFVPFVVDQITRYAPDSASVSMPGLHLASMLPGGEWLRWLAVPLAMAAFAIVWLASHSINVLVALCPIGFIDAGLKAIKGFLVSAVAVTALVNPWLGAAVSLLILFVAGLMAPWAFRLTLFGALFGLDVLLPWRGRRLARAEAPHGFLARKIGGAPVRTFGRLSRNGDGAVVFRYRPWLILPARMVAVHGETAIAKGMLFPSLLHKSDASAGHAKVVMFLPRYRSHEEAIAAHFAIAEIQPSGLVRGFRAFRAWLSEMFESRPDAIA